MACGHREGKYPFAFDRRFVAELLDVVLHHLVGSLHRAVRMGVVHIRKKGRSRFSFTKRSTRSYMMSGAVRLLRIFVVAVRVERIGALVERRARGSSSLSR